MKREYFLKNNQIYTHVNRNNSDYDGKIKLLEKITPYKMRKYYVYIFYRQRYLYILVQNQRKMYLNEL